MYARLAFATAAATDPDILLIDEVLSVGDAAFQRKCKDKMDEFISDNKTIILVRMHRSQLLICVRLHYCYQRVRWKRWDFLKM